MSTAAERLLRILDDCSPAGLCEPDVAADAREALAAARAEGAREAMERIREWANDNVWTGADGTILFAEALYSRLDKEGDR